MAVRTATPVTKRGQLLFFLISGITLVIFFLLGSSKIRPFGSPYTMKTVNDGDAVSMDNDIVSLENDAAFGNHWQQVSWYDIENVFRPRTLATCQNKCEKTDLGCRAKTFNEYAELLSSSKLKFVPLLSNFQYVYLFEKEYLSHSPLNDSKKLPDLNMSKVVMTGAKNNVVHCDVNDVVTGRVDLLDGYGDQRTTGGDEVRVWVVNKQEVKLRAPGQVTDLRNGSYQISIRCLWPGELELNIALPYPREYLRVVIQQSGLGATRYLAGRFKNKDAEEVTICWSTPNIPGRPCVCNLTSINQQSFYCGRPLDPRLNCSNWDATLALTSAQPQNVTQVEDELVKKTPGSARKYLLHHNIQVIVNNAGQLPVLLPCTQISPRITWDWKHQPSGYWSPKDGWTSLVCRRPKMTTAWSVSCLKDTRVWIFGDSNGVRIYWTLSSVTKASRQNVWPMQGTARQKSGNITITFTPLEYPLYLGADWVKRLPYGGVAKNIDAIPSHGKHIVVVHYYVHVTPSHFSVLHSRLNAVHEAIRRLILRNPDVLVGLRGPHISSSTWDYNHAIGGDNLGVEYLRLVENIFQDLHHKVVFLDGWGMSIARENQDFHPTNDIPFELFRTLLSFKCS